MGLCTTKYSQLFPEEFVSQTSHFDIYCEQYFTTLSLLHFVNMGEWHGVKRHLICFDDVILA